MPSCCVTGHVFRYTRTMYSPLLGRSIVRDNPRTPELVHLTWLDLSQRCAVPGMNCGVLWSTTTTWQGFIRNNAKTRKREQREATEGRPKRMSSSLFSLISAQSDKDIADFEWKSSILNSTPFKRLTEHQQNDHNIERNTERQAH